MIQLYVLSRILHGVNEENDGEPHLE